MPIPLITRGDTNGKRKTSEMPALRVHTKHIKRFPVQSYRKIQRPALQELRQTLSCEGKMKPVSTRAPAPKLTQALLKSKHPHDKQNIQDLIAALRSQLNHVRDQTAFLALKRSEMRPDDQVSLYGFMDAHEQLKIEKSLLAGHAYMVQQILAKRKQSASPEIQRILCEIEKAAYCRSWPELISS